MATDGTGAGLKGWNCRHDFYPFIPGISERAYTDEELKNIDPPPFEYEGKTYDAYEASQMQRRMETEMRKTKRELIGFENAELDDAYTAAAIKLRRQKEYYKDFSNKAGLPLQNERMQVLGFGRKEAQKAVWAEKKYVDLDAFNEQLKQSNNPRRIHLDDEKIKQTVDVDFEILKGIVPKGSDATNVYIMSGYGTCDPIRDIKRLAAQNPQVKDQKKWVKKSADVYTQNYKYVVHWYENEGYVPIEDIKTKGVKKL